MRRQRATHLLLTALLAAVAIMSGCVAESEDAFGLSSSRTFEEELLAEDIAALLPGSWSYDAAASTHALPGSSGVMSIVFLGHDAVSGDIALLAEVNQGDRLEPARVGLDESDATLMMPERDFSLRIERIEDDLLVLQGDAPSVRLVYHRHR